MQRGTKALGLVALALFVAGVASWLYAYGPADLQGALTSAAVYSRNAAGNPVFLAAAAGAVACFVTGLAAGMRGRAAQPRSGASFDLSAEVDEQQRQKLLVSIERALHAGLRGKPGDMIGFVSTLIGGAIRARASDVHIHPLADGTRIALRIDGTLREVATLASELHDRLIGRLKVMARLVTYKSAEPQDGHFAVETPHGPAEIRVSILPTNHGETAVLRVAAIAARLPELASLGMPAPLMSQFVDVLARAQGLVFLTGPTGSGKTTTIYAAISEIQNARGATTHIATIEDPIEFNIASLSQTQINPAAGLTFAKGLRSLLRQDPNVLVVGEIRDAETAEIAAQAGLTGHLILTTVHADSAAGVFNRLIDIGVEPFVVASASLACVSQRLVRRLCRSCKHQIPASAEERARLASAGVEIGEAPFWSGRGCSACAGSGFLGRLPVFELLELTPAVRELVTNKVPTANIHEAAVRDGMVPLLNAGLDRARAGDTTLAEIIRIAA